MLRAHIERRLRIVLTAIATSLALVVAPMAVAAPDDENRSPSHSATETRTELRDVTADVKASAEVDRVQREVVAISAYVSDELVLDYSAAAQDSSIRDRTLDEFAAGLVVGGGSVVAPPEITSAVHESANVLAGTSAANDLSKASCGGKNGFRNWYPTVFLDSCFSSALSALLGTGAGISAIAGLLTAATGAGAVVAGAIAAALTVYSGLFAICNSWGQGIGIYANPIGGPPVCWSQ